MSSRTRRPAPDQAALFGQEEAQAAPEPARHAGRGLGLLAEALAGDGYGWLTARLPLPAPLRCPRCGGVLQPRAGAIVPACGACYPEEARGAGV